MTADKPDFDSKIAEANAHIEEGRMEEAIFVLESLLESQPWAVQVQHQLCTLYLDTGRTDIPSAWLGNAIKEDPTLREILMNRAIRYLKHDELEKSNDIVRSLVWADPDNVKAWNHLGAIRYCLGDLWTAEKALLQALKLDPACVEATLKLVRLYKELEKPDQAMAVASRALQTETEPSHELATRLADALEPLVLEEIDQRIEYAQE